MRKPSRSRQSVARWCNRAVRCGGLAGLLISLMCASPAVAITISTDFTQNGGILNASGDLWVNHATNNPLLTLTNGAATSNVQQVIIGYQTGRLLINGGSVLTNSKDGYLGVLSGGNGTATVTGAGAKWTNNGTFLDIGSNGTGELNIENGGTVSSRISFLGYSTTSSGFAKVTGAGSTWTASSLFVGYYGTGVLKIENGGTVSSSYPIVGYDTNSSGTAIVTGPGTNWTSNDYLSIGQFGQGTLRIENGGAVSNPEGTIGYFGTSNGTVTVTGAGSTWTNSESLFVGRSGAGTLTVENGGSVSAKTLYAPISSLHGNGTISAKGAVLDGVNLLFDTAQGNLQTVSFGSGGQLLLNFDGTSPLGVGYKGTGTIIVTDGVSATTAAGYLGYRGGSLGVATVTGSGSKWIMSGDLSIGSGGNGVLMIERGGGVLNNKAFVGAGSDAAGIVTVSGAGSQWINSSDLVVGNNGAGTLTIQDGGYVSSASGSLGGYFLAPVGTPSPDADSVGSVTVTGAGSKWVNGGHLYLGFSGTGILNVKNGGSVETGTLYAPLSSLHGDGEIIAHGTILDGVNLSFDATTGSQQTIPFGSGGQLRLNLDGSGVLGAGYNGAGTLTIAGGVTIASAQGRIGHNRNSTGIVTVTGTGSQWLINNERLFVGFDGSAELKIEKGGMVVTGGGSLGGNSPYRGTGTATITGAGSKWMVGDDLYVGDLGFGELSVNDGGLVDIAAGHWLYVWTGILRGSGGVVKGNVFNDSEVAPGGSPGILTIDGNYEQAGKLTFELAGTPANSHDRLVITGEAALGGTLQVLLINGFTPSPGATFDLLDWSSVTGAFDNLQLPILGGGLSWNISRLYTTGVLSVSVPGDFDSDGDVDGADFVAWQTHFPRATGATLAQGDADGDGDVDGADFVVWQTHFPFSPSPGAVPVPEPKTGTMLLTASIALAIVAFRRSTNPALRLARPGAIMICASMSLPSARADIYQWEWVNPSDHTLGRQPSSTLCIDGAGVIAAPNADLSNKNLTTAYLIGADVGGAQFAHSTLTNADFTEANLANANFTDATLTDVNFLNAEVRGVHFDSAPNGGFTAQQLYATASYQNRNLTEIRLGSNNLTNWNFEAQNLTNASLSLSTLTGTNFLNADVRGADFSGTTQYGFTSQQLYDTASYKNHNLSLYMPGLGIFSGIDLSGNNLSSWNFVGQNLTNARFYNATLSGASFLNAEVRGANFYSTTAEGFTAQQLYDTASYQNHDLRGIGMIANDLTNWNLSGQNLSLAQFGIATLTNANLAGANLTAASFYYATLRGAILTNANLSGADLTGANLLNANIGGADLSSVTQYNRFIAQQLYDTASYQNHDLTGIDLSFNNLANWSFAGQNLRNASFYEATLTGANFSNADVRGASFAGTINFTPQQLYDTASYVNHDLTGIVLTSKKLGDSNFAGQILINAGFENATLNGANLSQAILTRTNFANAILTGADFSNAEVREASFYSTTDSGFTAQQLYDTASYQNRDLTGINLSGNNLSNWNFAGQILANVNFANTVLTNANLSQTDLKSKNLSKVVLTEANLSQANVTKASFAGATLTGTNFSDV